MTNEDLDSKCGDVVMLMLPFRENIRNIFIWFIHFNAREAFQALISLRRSHCE